MKPLLNQARGNLKNLLESAQVYQALLDTGRDHLPYEMQAHLLGVGFEGQELLLQIDSPAWATRMRFYEPTILGTFQQHFPHLQLRSVKVAVLPNEERPKPKKVMQSHPSQSDALAMQQLSQNVESKELRDALIKLSQRAQKPR
ncbi:DciA family protein [Thiosulfatimonas sediminis]|uniref:DciA family protein n=1 Tax=Thiosulfatimonas sediminis TaxID=2675054 RepID=UPI0015637BD8|nr:DciA family protein [Thiosulfatimonas sediminis]